MKLTARLLKDATRHLKKSDPVLNDVIRLIGPIEIKVKRGRFQTLVSSIVSQQISGAAAKTILGRLSDLIDRKAFTPDRLLQFDIDQLREVGVSRQKATYVLDLAEKVHSREVRLHRLGKMPNEEVIEELTQVKGVGVWTAQMFLMFSLGRMDILPTGDLGIQNAIKLAYGLRKAPDAKKIRSIASPWSPFQTVACCYLWRRLDM